MPKINYRWKGRIVSKKMYEKKKKLSEEGMKLTKKSSLSVASNLEGKEKSEEPEIFEELTIKQEIQPKLEDEEDIAEQPLQSTEFVLIKQEEYCQEEKEENEIYGETAEEQEEPDYFNGRRIVELKFLAREMWCCSCKEALSFQFIENETRRGFGSILRIRCHKCSIRNIVTTGKEYTMNTRRNTSRFEINCEAVKGAEESGIKFTNLKKFCGQLNIPCLDAGSFKKYKDELKMSELE